MTELHPIILTTTDHAILEGLWHRSPREHEQRQRMLSKLESAILVAPADISPDIATINSRIRYQVGSSPADERTLTARHGQELSGLTLPIWTARGLAYLGMQAGQQALFALPTGRVVVLTLEAVLYQPEAAMFPTAETGAAPAETSNVVVSLSRYRLRQARQTPSFGGSDGPGAA